MKLFEQYKHVPEFAPGGEYHRLHWQLVQHDGGNAEWQFLGRPAQQK